MMNKRTEIVKFKISYALIGLICIIFFGCQKNDKDGDDGFKPIANKDSVMIELLNEVAEDGHTIMDIAPIPVQDELYDYANIDTNFLSAIEAIESYNDLIGHPGILLGTSDKSTNGDNWQFKGCNQEGTVSLCIWELDKGEYIYKVEQTRESMTGAVMLDTYLSGTYDGIFYGELGSDFYHISNYTTLFNDLQFMITQYFAPTHEGVFGEPVFFYSMTVGETRTIYTPWGGTEIILDNTYVSIIYSWDGIDGHHESIHRVMHWEGDLLSTITSVYCPAYKTVMPFYSSTYDFERHEGSWCTFDCDGNVISCHESR